METILENYHVVQYKGQRIFRPKDVSFDTEEYDEFRNSEVFIEHLPDDLFELELLAFLSRIGPVYQIRILLQFSQKTKGKAFVVFCNVSDAYRAVNELNNQWIRPDHPPIRVAFSANNKRLHLMNVPIYMTEEILMNQLNLIGITQMKIFKPIQKETKIENFNHAIISFETHQMAASARRLFVSGDKRLDGLQIISEWAKPKDNQTLFVVFQGELTETIIREHFECHLAQIKTIHFNGRSVFIKYLNFEMANFVYGHFNRKCPFELDGVKIIRLDWPIRK